MRLGLWALLEQYGRCTVLWKGGSWEIHRQPPLCSLQSPAGFFHWSNPPGSQRARDPTGTVQRPASWARAGWEGVESGSGGASKEIVHAAHCFTLLSFVWVKKPHWPPYYRRIMSTKSHPHLDPKMLTSFVHMRMWRTRGERNSHLP